MDYFKAFEGKSSDEIAKFLLSEDIKGEPGIPTDCPISKYLTKRFNKRFSVTGLELQRWPTFETVCAVPGNVKEFMDKFDEGRYPKLVLKSS